MKISIVFQHTLLPSHALSPLVILASTKRAIGISAAESALVAQSTFRRIEDEEGTEAALKAAIDRISIGF